VKINLQVENINLTNPEFLDVLHRACWELSQRRKIKIFCLHEVGHLAYFEPIRKIIGPDTPELEFLGPTISYNGFKNKFEFTPAAIKTPFEECGIPYSEEVMDHVTRGAVAGGVFLQELEHMEIGGDSEDNTLFNTHFDLARGKGWVPTRTRQRMWDDAQAEVRSNLQDELFKQLVLQRAARLEVEHFSLRDDS
jgi:hypothetical protein